MQNLQSIKRSINSAENLQSIVSTMKAHASTNITRFQNAANASMEYRYVLDLALYVLIKDQEEEFAQQNNISSGDTIHMIFGSDHGLAGRFNEKIVAYALDNIPKKERELIVVIGHQVLSRLENEFKIEDFFSVAQTTDGITSMVQKLLLTIEKLMNKGNIQEVILYYNKPVEFGSFQEGKEILFPIEFKEIREKISSWDSKSLPTYLVEKEVIFSDLIQQYFFITLYRTICYSLASENSSRLSSMESAQKNIQERLNELELIFRRERQNSITEEINDVVSGFKAIKKSKESFHDTN